MEATQTLVECATDEIQDRLETAEADPPRVLWWDEGGHLQSTIERACAELSVVVKTATETPLELRADPSNEPEVWYAPIASDEYDWFRDIEADGAVISKTIEDLAVRTFSGETLRTWSLYDTTQQGDADGRAAVASVLQAELSDRPLPTFEQLRTKIVTGGFADPVTHLLKNGWAGMATDEHTVSEIRELLLDRDVRAVADATTPTDIVETTKRWAVAEWLVAAGVDPSLFPDAYRPQSTSRPTLEALFESTSNAAELAETYLRSYWSDELDGLENPTDVVDCPVGGALEHRLWDVWQREFETGAYDHCETLAVDRQAAVKKAYGSDVPWVTVWKQAVALSQLASKLEDWADTASTEDIVATYADAEDGFWRIDRAVHDLLVSGRPERDLPSEVDQPHPARDTLADLRDELTVSEYADYLDELAALTVEAIETGRPFLETAHAHEFWSDERERLRSSETVAIFIIDALRFDLAHELADTIRDAGYAVDEEVRLGTLPSATKFGKGVLTPGGRHSYAVRLDDGTLVPERNGQRLTNRYRERLLEGDGWSVTRERTRGWDHTRVVYYSNELDDIGENEFEDTEALLTDRVGRLASFITEKLRQGDWSRAYVLTDHGFISLPDDLPVTSVSPPDGSADVHRRWVAGKQLDEDGPGITLDADTPLGYLDEGTEIRLLADPLVNFSKRGLGQAHFYHGGLLPQEFVLDFLTITSE